MVNIAELAAHGIAVTQRPPNPEETAIVQTYVKNRRDSQEAHLRSSGREPLILVVLGALLVPVFLLMPMQAGDGPGLRIGLALLALLFAGIGVAGWVRQRQRAVEKLAAFDALHAPWLTSVDELTFRPHRVLLATDADGDGQDWLLFEVENGFFVRERYTEFGQDIGSEPWRERVTLVCMAYGSILTAKSEGELVPQFDGSLKPPNFAIHNESAFWSPNYEAESEADIVPAEEVWAGTWPEAARNLGNAPG